MHKNGPTAVALRVEPIGTVSLNKYWLHVARPG